MPVVAVVRLAHNHVDHYGGVKGVVSEADVASGKVAIIAPEGFLEAAVAENVFAGNAMSRRATYMYGNLLPPDPGAGRRRAGHDHLEEAATSTLIRCTITGTAGAVERPGLQFQLAPDTEGARKEECTGTSSSCVRSAPQRTAATRCTTPTLLLAIHRHSHRPGRSSQRAHGPLGQPHRRHVRHAPLAEWGNDHVIEMIEKAATATATSTTRPCDCANHGLTPVEIAEEVEFPPELASHWAMRPTTARSTTT